MKQSILILLAFLGIACKKEVKEEVNPVEVEYWKTDYYSVNSVPDSVRIDKIVTNDSLKRATFFFVKEQKEYLYSLQYNTIIIDSFSLDYNIKVYKVKNSIFAEYKGYTNELR